MRTLGNCGLGALYLVLTLAGCAGQEGSASEELSSSEQGCHESKHERFAVFSDAHLYDTALGTEGAAFQAYLASDRKMLVQSEPILRSVVDRIIEEHPRFVLVPGDLTKDGEYVDHVKFAHYMKKLERAGVEVYVIPGNHDVMNPDAVRYVGDIAEPVRNVTEREFAKIYREFGYGEALDRDTDSLSYVAEPAPGVWLLAIDSTRHRENTTQTGPVTAGRLSTNTLTWVLDKLAQAKRHGKHVIGMMHHGLLEHYTGQTLLFPEYVIENYTNLSKQLADAGMPVVFTGHFHANDVTAAHWDNGSTLFDVETGSLVTAPSPYRFVDYFPREQQIVITTEHVTSIEGMPDFAPWAVKFLDDGIKELVTYQLTASGLADAATAQAIAPVIAVALEGHYAGDESAPDATVQQIAGLLKASGSPAGQAWGYSLISLHTDLAPADNDTVLDLSSGVATTP